MQNPKITTDHKLIREWIEARGGIPVRIAATETPTEDEGYLDIKFDRSNDEIKYVKLSWQDFFTKFEQSHLAFQFDDGDTVGGKSKYFKFIWRNGE